MHILLYLCAALLMIAIDVTLSTVIERGGKAIEVDHHDDASSYAEGSNYQNVKTQQQQSSMILKNYEEAHSTSRYDDPDYIKNKEMTEKELSELINSEVIGEAVDDLNGQCCIVECSLADFLLDIYFEHGADLITNSCNIRRDANLQKTRVVAMLNGGAIHSSIPKGQITLEHLSDISFDNTIYMGYVVLSGSKIKKAIENAVWEYDGHTPHTEFLQVSGMTMVIDPHKPPGQRLQSVKIKSTSKELDDNETYYVILSRFMFGDMWQTYGYGNDLKFIGLEKTLLDYARYYMLYENKTISKKTDGRIRILG